MGSGCPLSPRRRWNDPQRPSPRPAPLHVAMGSGTTCRLLPCSWNPAEPGAQQTPPTQLWVSLRGGRPAQSAEKSGSPFLFTLETSAHLFLTVLPPCRCRSRSSVRTVTWGKQGTVCWEHTAPARGAQRRKEQGRAGIRTGPGVSLTTQLPVALSPSGVEFSGQNGSGPA